MMSTIPLAVLRDAAGIQTVTDPDTGKVYPIPAGGADDAAAGDDGDDDTDSGADDLEAEVQKWKALARKHEKQAKANADKARQYDELEDSQKSELEKATGKAADAEKRATEAERRAQRLEVALDKAPEGMPIAQVRKLAKRLQGDSPEDLEADAEELFADFAPSGDDTDEDDDTDDTSGSRRPREKLKPGASHEDDDDQVDGDKLADQILSRKRI